MGVSIMEKKNKIITIIKGVGLFVLGLLLFLAGFISVILNSSDIKTASADSYYSMISTCDKYMKDRYYNKSAHMVYPNDTLTYTSTSTAVEYYFYVNGSAYFYYGTTEPTTDNMDGGVIAYGGGSSSYPIYGFCYSYLADGGFTLSVYNSLESLITIYTSGEGWLSEWAEYRVFQINTLSAKDTSSAGKLYSWIKLVNSLNATTNSNTVTIEGVNCEPSLSSATILTTGSEVSVIFTPTSGYSAQNALISLSSTIAGDLTYSVDVSAYSYTITFTSCYRDVTFVLTLSDDADVSFVITPNIQNAVMQGSSSTTYTYDDFPLSIIFEANAGYSFKAYDIDYSLSYGDNSLSTTWTQEPDYSISDDGKYLYITLYAPVYTVDNIEIYGSPESVPYSITPNVWGASGSSSNTYDIDGGGSESEAVTLEFTAFSNLYLSFDDNGNLENWTVENASVSYSWSDDKTVIYVSIWNATGDVTITGSFVVAGKGTAQAAGAFTVFITPCIEFMTAPILGGYSIIDVLCVPLFIGLALIFIKLFAGG